MPAVFVVEPQVISHLIVRQNEPLPEDQPPPLPLVLMARMPCSPPMASSSALPLPAHPPAAAAIPASIFMDAAFVAAPNTEPVVVDPLQDPRSVVTPINAHKAELLLRTCGIYDSWSHVIAGLRSGFDIGI